MVLVSRQMYAQANSGEYIDEGSYASEQNCFNDEVDLPIKKEFFISNEFDLAPFDQYL